MHKLLTAGLTALSLILIPAAPVHAQSDRDDASKFILGLLAAGALGLAIQNNQNDVRPRASLRITTRDQRAHQPQRHTYNTRRQQTVDLLPGRCFRRVETGRGGYQGVYPKRCLDRRYRDAHTLPRQCVVRIGGQHGSRRGYDAACLRDFGYRSDRRWN